MKVSEHVFGFRLLFLVFLLPIRKIVLLNRQSYAMIYSLLEKLCLNPCKSYITWSCASQDTGLCKHRNKAEGQTSCI